MTRKRSLRSLAPWSSAAISLIPPGPMATDGASRFLPGSCARTKTGPASAGPTSISMWPRKFRRRTGAGRAVANSRSRIAFRRLKDERLPRSIEKMKKSGKVRAFAPSINRWEPWNGIRAVLEGHAEAVQVIYNLFDQNPEDALFPICRMRDAAVIARVPFDEGTLTGTLTLASQWPAGDWRNSYFVPENLKASVERAEVLRPLVPAGSTMSEMALRFILANSVVSTTIPGMRKLRNVEANCQASAAGTLPLDLQRKLQAHRWDRNPTSWSQ